MRMLHWIRQGLKMVGMLLIACLIYTLLMTLQDDQFIWKDVLILAGSYTLLFGMFLSILFSTTLYTQDIPLVISFGATRREAFWGLQVSRASYTVLMALCAGSLFLMASDISLLDLSFAIPFALAGYLVLHALGAIMSILYVKFQKKGLIAFGTVLICVFIGGLAGFILAVNGDPGFELPKYTCWLVVAAGVLVYGLVSAWEYRIIRNYNVKL